MGSKKSSSASFSREGNTTEIRYHHHDAPRGSSEAARSRLPANINWESLTPEKQKNCERAFTAASRRSDRDIDARYQSALTASDMHFLRTGKYLRVTRDMVINEEMYEEEDSHPRLWTSNLRQDSDPRIAALNQQYQNIDLQFQAAFPGFGSRGSMSIAPTAVPYPSTIPAPQFDTMQYTDPYVSESYTPVSFSSDESSPPPMTDSASASPMVGFSTPSPTQPHMSLPMAHDVSQPSHGNICLSDNLEFSGMKYDYSGGYVNEQPFFPDMPDMWNTTYSNRPDDFAEFVNY